MNLTGRTRYRATWLGRLILQVQLANRSGTWRDAKVEDVSCGQVREDLIGVFDPTSARGFLPPVRNPLPMPSVNPLKQV